MQRVPYSEFAHGAIGMYKPGRFYSQSLFGLADESDLLYPKGVGRTDFKSQFATIPGGVQKTLRLIVLLHEMSHYLHDLSLGACMASDYALDQSYGALAKALRSLSSRKLAAHAPLMASGRIEHWLADPELRQAAEIIKERETWVASLWGHPPGLAEYCRRRDGFQSVADCVQELTGDAACEGLVAAKTVVALADRIGDAADARYLEANKHALRLFPENLPPAYNIARCVYDAVLGRLLDPQQWKLDEIWPLRYRNSPRSISDIGFMYLADIALHIPPRDTIVERIRMGRNTPEDFWPAFRFCKALESLRRRGGFPPDDPNTSPEFYYIRVFDSLAADPQLRWPTFEQTNNAWKSHLALFKQGRREAADGYRFRMLVEREKKPHTVVMCDPLFVCWSQNVPLFHLTPAAFKILRAWKVGETWYLMPLEPPDMVVMEMFTSNIPLWKDMPTEATLDNLVYDHDNAMLLHQEVIYRSICAELRSSVLYKDSFSCPFTPRGCVPSSPSCTGLQSLGIAPHDRCCIRGYLKQDRIAPECVVWSE